MDLVSGKIWKVMTSSPREKDVWMDALKKVLGTRCIVELHSAVEATKPLKSNLERSDSKRSEVRSLPMLDEPSSDTPFKRSYSAGPSMAAGKVPRSADSSPIPTQENLKVGFYNELTKMFSKLEMRTVEQCRH